MSQQAPKRPEPGGNPPARSDNERREERPANPPNRREARAENQSEAEGSAASRPKRRKPVKNLNWYMRGVAVASLLVVGGVGVYKGRGMMNAKPPAEVAANTATTPDGKSPIEPAKITTDSKSFIPNTDQPTPSLAPKAASTTKPEVKKASPLSSFGKKDSAAQSKAKPAEKKTSSAGKFNFGGSKASDKKAEKPTASRLTDDTGDGYSADPAPTADEYGTATPLPSNSAGGGDGYVADVPAAPQYGTGDAQDEGYSAGPATESPQNSDNGYSGELADATPVPNSASRMGFGGTNSQPTPAEPKPSSRLGGLTTPPANSIPSNPRGVESRVPENRFATTPVPANPLPTVAESDNSRIDRGAALATPLPGRSNDSTLRSAQEEADITPIPTPSGGEVRSDVVGPQTPSITVEKFAPEEVQVGRAAMFEIEVKNVGNVSAYDVTVVDEVPRGTRFAQANPQPTMSKTGGLVWKLGTMKPNEERIIQLELVPETEGEIGSVAQVSFQAQAGVRSVVTRPKLEIRHESPQQVHAGESATVKLTITNTGTGVASNLLLQSDVPAGFTHEAGQSLETKVNPLRPGESTQISLNMQAVKAGVYEQTFVVAGDGEVAAEDSAKIQVVAPSLQVSVAGPKKRFVERQATHDITITNPGTAAAKDVDLVVRLPRGFKFVSANPKDAGGQYDAAQHAVVWGLEELPPGSSAVVQLTTLPVEAGDQQLRVEAQSAGGLNAEAEQLVQVDAVAELPFTIADLADPIEIGSETAYEIRVSNRGAKDATNVVIAVAFPPDLKPLEGEGAARASVAGQNVQFEPIGRIPPGTEVVVKVHAEGLRAGDHRIAVSLTSDDQQQAVTREESTRVYADQ